MKICHLCVALLIVLFSSCTRDQKYQYIELVREKGLISGYETKEKDTEVIVAKNDSLAYLKAFEKFCISVKANKIVSEKMGESYSTPISFKLVNSEGINITDRILFQSKETSEQEISERIFSLEIGKSDSENKKQETPIIDSVKINELIKYFIVKKDEFDVNGKTWYTPKSAPKYTNRNGIYCYFQTSNNKPTNLRFRIQYHSDDWLFFKKVQFSIDDVAYEYIPASTETDSGNGGMIWEWFDEQIAQSDKPLITALTTAKNAKMKFIGRQYYDIKNITSQQILDIMRTIELYNAMGGNY